MTNQLINAAAFIAAITTVVFERFVAPTSEAMSAEASGSTAAVALGVDEVLEALTV